MACADFDVCSSLFMCVEAQRGVLNLANGNVRHLFRYEIRIDNTSGRTLNQFDPRLNLRCTFVRETQDALNGMLVQTSDILADPSHALTSVLPVFVTASGCPVNPYYNGGLPSTVGGTDGDDHLLEQKSHLPPGEILLVVCVAIDTDPVARPYDGFIVTSGLFSVTGVTDHCELVHRALVTPQECLAAQAEDLLAP